MCLVELERVEMDDRVKQDEYRRSLTVDDDTSVCFGSLPVPMFHEPFTEFFLSDRLCV